MLRAGVRRARSAGFDGGMHEHRLPAERALEPRRAAAQYRERAQRTNPAPPSMDLLPSFLPLLDAARGLDLADPARAAAELERRLPADSAQARTLNRELAELAAAGRIANRGAPPVLWGRALKPSPASHDYSVDVVVMTGAGPRHCHTSGEIDWCVPLEGAPEFEGCRAGWVVLPPGSVHVPEVRGGRMLIVYLLPAGKIEFLEA